MTLTLVEDIFMCIRYNIISSPPFECFDYGTVADTEETSRWAGEQKNKEYPDLIKDCPIVRVVKCRVEEVLSIYKGEERMNIKEIVKKYLEDNGFDGLFDEDGECACEKEDLFPCDGYSAQCKPGYNQPCDCGDHDFHIGAEKLEKEDI